MAQRISLEEFINTIAHGQKHVKITFEI